MKATQTNFTYRDQYGSIHKGSRITNQKCGMKAIQKFLDKNSKETHTGKCTVISIDSSHVTKWEFYKDM